MLRGGAGGSTPLARVPVADPARKGRTSGPDQWQWNSVVLGCSLALLRIVEDGRFSAQPFRPHPLVPEGNTRAEELEAGRPRASPEPTVPWVTGLLSPAVRSHLWGEVPRRTNDPYASSPQRRSHAWFFRARPWLARTSGPTKAVGNRSRAVRVRRRPNSGPWRSGSACARTPSRAGPDRSRRALAGRMARPRRADGAPLRSGGCGPVERLVCPCRTAQTRPRHSSRSVIASAVPGLPSASR